MIPPKALPIYHETTLSLANQVPVLPAHRVELGDALGRILRQDVTADHNQPFCDRSAIDGYAVRSQEVQPDAIWTVIDPLQRQRHGHCLTDPLPRHTVVKVTVGAAMPRGADAVVAIDQVAAMQPQIATAEHLDHSLDEGSGNEHLQFTIQSLPPGRNVRRRGSDFARGTVVLHAGLHLGAHHIGLASAVGATSLLAVDLPRVCLLMVGQPAVKTELRTNEMQRHPLHESIGPMLTAFFHSLGIRSIKHENVSQDPKSAVTAVTKAAAESDLLLVIERGDVKANQWLAALCPQLGLTKILDGVAIQPGGSILAAGDRHRLIFGLPGEPIAALAAAYLHVWPAVRRMTGMECEEAAALPWRRVRLAQATATHSQYEVCRLACSMGEQVAQVTCESDYDQLPQAARSDGWVRLPITSDPAQRGSLVPFLPFLN